MKEKVLEMEGRPRHLFLVSRDTHLIRGLAVGSWVYSSHTEGKPCATEVALCSCFSKIREELEGFLEMPGLYFYSF